MVSIWRHSALDGPVILFGVLYVGTKDALKITHFYVQSNNIQNKIGKENYGIVSILVVHTED